MFSYSKASNDPEDALYDRFHERNKTLVEEIDNLVVYKHISKGAGGPEDEPRELFDPSKFRRSLSHNKQYRRRTSDLLSAYQRVKQPEKFFRVGQVFQMIDSLTEPGPREGTYIIHEELLHRQSYSSAFYCCTRRHKSKRLPVSYAIPFGRPRAVST